jgi:hypothetical protein
MKLPPPLNPGFYRCKWRSYDTYNYETWNYFDGLHWHWGNEKFIVDLLSNEIIDAPELELVEWKYHYGEIND